MAIEFKVVIEDADELRTWALENAWQGAADRVKDIEQLDLWESVFDIIDGSELESETDLNDIFWFELDDVIYQSKNDVEE